MPTNEKNGSKEGQPDRTNDATPGGDPLDEQKKGANESSVSRVESGGTGSSAGELSIDPNRLKGD